MALCPECDLLSIDELRHNDVPLKLDLADLVTSAERGCPLCLMCWTQLRRDCHPTDIEKHLMGVSESCSRRTNDYVYLSLRLDEDENDKYRTNRGMAKSSRCGLMVSIGPAVRKFDINTVVQNPFVTLPLQAHLDIFAEPDTLAAKYIRGRNFTASKTFAHQISWMRSRLSECRDHHQQCAVFTNREMPTRIIDLGQMATRSVPYILETRGRWGQYIALSYCWGDGVKPQVKLKKATYAAMLKTFDEGQLTQTHQETLYIARELGYRYVWIDALCIIQDDINDWMVESSRMTECYQNANLTLIAGRSGDSSKGFTVNNFVPELQPLRFKYAPPTAPSDISECYLCLFRTLDVGPVSERAWCFQEEILSRRRLVFGAEQLIFHCREQNYNESGWVLTRSLDDLTASQNLNIHEFATFCDNSNTTESILPLWYTLVHQYTSLNMFEPHDIFAALMGLAKIAQRAIRCRYLTGIWEDDLVRGLLWQTEYHTRPEGGLPAPQRPKERNIKKPHLLGLPAVRAPSWSWASIEGQVVFSTYLPQEHNSELFKAENLCIHPLHENPTRWTMQMDCDVGMAFMPVCELELLGAPKQAICSRSPVPDKVKHDTNWRFAAARVAAFSALLDMKHPEKIIGMGLFDIEQEWVDSLWCMRLLKDRRLMLHLDQEGKFHRLGKFVVLDKEWFYDDIEQKVLLV